MTRRAESFAASFRYASAGLRLLFTSQRNARVQAMAGAGAIALGAVVRLARVEWMILTVTIALVLSLEALNSAIEATVDLAVSEYHPLAKMAKDLAAGAVWLMALASVAIGLLLFLPRLLPLLTGNR